MYRRLSSVAVNVGHRIASRPMKKSAVKFSTKSRVQYTSAVGQLFSGQPSAPVIDGAFPGKAAKAATEKLNHVYDTRNLNMMVDYEKSIGNFIADPDGNLLLDW